MDIIGNNLRMLREALNLTQSDVADQINTSRDYISKIELGLRPSVSQNVLEFLCIELNTTEEWLTKSNGWANDPETTWKALKFFERQIKKFQPDEIIIISYRDGLLNANGFVFIKPGRLISMAGRQTLSGDWSDESRAYRDALLMIKDAKIKVGRIELDEIESQYLIHADLSDIAKRAKYDKNVIEKELQALKLDQHPEPAKSDPDSTIIFTDDEIMLLREIRKSKADIKDVLRYLAKRDHQMNA